MTIPTPDESGERVSDALEMADKLLDIHKAMPYGDLRGILHQRYGLHLEGVALDLARALIQSRRSTDTRTEVRAAALEEAAKVCEPFFKDKHVGAAAVTIRDLICALKANTPPPREGE